MMKEIEVNNLGMQEMDTKSMKEVSGGIFCIDDLLIGCGIAAFSAIISDWDNFERGFKGQKYVK